MSHCVEIVKISQTRQIRPKKDFLKFNFPSCIFSWNVHNNDVAWCAVWSTLICLYQLPPSNTEREKLRKSWFKKEEVDVAQCAVCSTLICLYQLPPSNIEREKLRKSWFKKEEFDVARCAVWSTLICLYQLPPSSSSARGHHPFAKTKKANRETSAFSLVGLFLADSSRWILILWWV